MDNDIDVDNRDDDEPREPIPRALYTLNKALEYLDGDKDFWMCERIRRAIKALESIAPTAKPMIDPSNPSISSQKSQD